MPAKKTKPKRHTTHRIPTDPYEWLAETASTMRFVRKFESTAKREGIPWLAGQCRYFVKRLHDLANSPPKGVHVDPKLNEFIDKHPL